MKLSHIAPSYFKSASSVLRVISLSLCLLFITGVVGCSKSASGKKDGADLNEADVNALREKRFGEGGIPTAEGEGLFKDIHFDFDSSAVKDAARLDAEYDAKVLKDNPDLKVTIEGHCDERGTSDYNLTLGQERAKAVKNLLISLGTSKSRLDTISYGAEVPLDTGHNEAAWAKNRRVHLSASTAAAH